MTKEIYIYNTLSRSKEKFESLTPGKVGLYVCGPTVYGDPHLGHARPAITFDLLSRLLRHLDYKVRYVRNITDVGHLENDADEGEDKIAKKAKLDELEPMEVVQYYTDRYHDYMQMLNVKSPSIEPRASGHIIEQQEVIKNILEKGYAYESNGSIYFDVKKYDQDFPYGILSGRKIEDLISNTRNLDGQSEKRDALDFALWKKAAPEHIMRWPSPWSDGFPGWHLECSAMSKKYLGEQFDIHGGGMDLLFPHHECEIAQSTVANGHTPAKYWMHNNMITIGGQKMGKSLGNFITLEQFFTGNHEKLEKAYSPMTIRFFILQAHYRSTLDFGNEALQAAEKGLERLNEAILNLDKISASTETTFSIEEFENKCYSAICDDLNSPILIANLFEGVKHINNLLASNLKISAQDLDHFKNLMKLFVNDILGLTQEGKADSGADSKLDDVMNLLLQLRSDAKANKDWGTADKIRNELQNLGFVVKDGAEGASWELK
ncbi:cysteine--tRNA ligase [Plebeiibacterium sediminum]|uniref:Cysteine--tRNA ligase n=1 Tax=Plebeiibacterium sediminum TaxID=2992112 RepID=A0AAE3SDI9_9BACT|nr:cysteine--tRNA ligase [Plebeiobacterium sediminum]MCW3785041.1 cysteine--tRNA ligase [Plebeiobacterium sediminum]